MKSFFQKLDRAASRWLNEFDGQMEQPVTQVMTGEVFTYQVTTAEHTDLPSTTQPTPTSTPGLPRRVGKDDLSTASPAGFRSTGMVTNQ